MIYNEIPSENKKRMEAMKNKMMDAAKKSGSEIAKAVANQKKTESDPEMRENCEAMRMLFNEALEMYESGKMSLKEMVDDMHGAMMALAGESHKMEKK